MAYEYPYSENSWGNPPEDYVPWEKTTSNPRDRSRQDRRVHFSNSNDNIYNKPPTKTTPPNPPTIHPDLPSNYDPQTRQIRRVKFKKYPSAESNSESSPYRSRILARIDFLFPHIFGDFFLALPLTLLTLSIISSSSSSQSTNLIYLPYNIPVLLSVLLTIESCFLIQVVFLDKPFSWKLVALNMCWAILVAIIVAAVLGPPLGVVLGLGVFGPGNGGAGWVAQRFYEFLNSEF